MKRSEREEQNVNALLSLLDCLQAAIIKHDPDLMDVISSELDRAMSRAAEAGHVQEYETLTAFRYRTMARSTASATSPSDPTEMVPLALPA